MSRFTHQSTLKEKQTLHPIWRGVGFLILALMTVGGYWLAGYLISLHLFPLPTNLDIAVGKFFKIPGLIVLKVMATGLLDILVYALMVVAWAMINPPKPGPYDAPPPRPRKPSSMGR